MQPHPLSAVVGDIDRQYLANIHHLRHKIARVRVPVLFVLSLAVSPPNPANMRV